MKNTKTYRITSLILAVVMLFGVFTAVPSVTLPVLAAAGGSDGKFIAPISILTPAMILTEGYKPISNRADLEKTGNNSAYPPDGKYYLTADIDLSGMDLSGKAWTPIDNFNGTLDGQGHSIILKNINPTLVGEISDGTVVTIKNIGINIGTQIVGQGSRWEHL